MGEMKVEHVLLFLVGAFLVYHMMKGCGRVEGMQASDLENATYLCKNYWRNCMCNGGTEAKCRPEVNRLKYNGYKCTDIEYDKNVPPCPVLFWTDCEWDPECPPGSRPWPGAYLSTDGCFPGWTRKGCTRTPPYLPPK